jgi:hypothetical protein
MPCRWCWGWGWGYRHVPVDFYRHWPLYHGNVYNRWGDRVVVNHIRNTFVSRGGDMRFVQHSRIGDLYAGHEGNVYRFRDGQWQRYEGGGWRPFAFHNPEPNHAQAGESFRQGVGTEGEGLRGHEPMGERAGGTFGGHESVESLNREAAARSLGESRWNDFRSGGGFATNHFGGRGFGGGFGGFHGGGFGGFHGGGRR